MNARLAPYAPIPFLRHTKGIASWVEQDVSGKSIGRLRAFHGQFATFVRAYAYMLSLGADGLQQASADAVLNANYLLARLQDALTPAYPAPCMHEALFSDKFLEGTGLSTLDYAKGMIDAGYHPMTMYFPLVVHGALLFEPTETESKATLDEFVTALKILADIAKKDPSRLQQAPLEAPRRRLDETQAARSPRLVWSAQQS
jgi:glycine dehydrogenase subunit 2